MKCKNQGLLAAKTLEAESLKEINGMTPVVFSALRLDGVEHVGVCFQPQGVKVGDKFHYDHGAGIHKNEDAEVLWVK